MQKLIFALLIASACAAPHLSSRASDFHCPEEDIAQTSCMGPKDCLYPNPENCKTFLQCTVNADGITGTPVVMPCAADLEWNDNTKECDYAGQPGTCSGQVASTAPPPESTTPKEVSSSTRGPGFVCPVEDIAATACMGPKDCLYPNDENCNTFIQCTVNADGITGTPVVMPCAADLEWNDITKECDYPGQPGTCSHNGQTSGPTSTAAQETSPSTAASTQGSGGESTSGDNGFVCPVEDIAATACMGPKDCLYPNDENCNTFIQCTVNADGITGTPVVMPCAANLEWNDITKECDYPGQPGTCSHNGQTSGPTSTAAQETSRLTQTTEQSSTAAQDESTAAPPSTGAPSSTRGPGFICPVEDIAATACMGPKDCLYPNDENCNTFIQCTVNADGITGTPVVMPCAANLEWNDITKECDYPGQPGTCSAQNRPSTPAAEETSEPSTASPSTAQPSTAEPSTAQPSTAEPSTAEPSTAQPSTAEPSTAEPSTAQPSTAEPSTAQPSTAEPSTAQPSTAEPSTAEPSTAEPSTAEPTTTETAETSTLPVCRPEDNEDDGLNLGDICGANCESVQRTTSHPKNNAKYIICSDEPRIVKCGPGLVYDADNLSCNYGGLVNGGPGSR